MKQGSVAGPVLDTRLLSHVSKNKSNSRGPAGRVVRSSADGFDGAVHAGTLGGESGEVGFERFFGAGNDLRPVAGLQGGEPRPHQARVAAAVTVFGIIGPFRRRIVPLAGEEVEPSDASGGELGAQKAAGALDH